MLLYCICAASPLYHPQDSTGPSCQALHDPAIYLPAIHPLSYDKGRMQMSCGTHAQFYCVIIRSITHIYPTKNHRPIMVSGYNLHC